MTMNLSFRTTPRPEDLATVRQIVASTTFFSPEEEDIAVELVAEHLNRGIASGYHFIFAESQGQTLGYSCYGPIPCTIHSFDLYWIAVHQQHRGHGIGSQLITLTESAIHDLHGTRVYAETSSRDQYTPTRTFYEHHGYTVDVIQNHFYAPNDHKVVYLKVLT